MLIKDQLKHKSKEHSRRFMMQRSEKLMYYMCTKRQVLNTFGGKKKAYIRLGGENDALNLANKIGII